MAQRIVDVLVPVALDHTYSYRAPPELDLHVGDLVAVPLGNAETVGVVWADNVPVRPGLHNRLKDIEAKLDYPPLRGELRRFIDWVANYTLAPRGMILRMALRMGELGPERERVAVRLSGPPPQRMTPARRRVMAALGDGLLRTKAEAAKDAGVSTGVIDGLVDEGTLEVVALPPEPVARQPDPDYREPELTGPQRMAADILRGAVSQGSYTVDLLDGVTGSGKTEVYFEAIAETIRRRRQSLVLMPEIALTAQFLDRFAARFGVRPAEWHSELGQRKRARTWNAVAVGEVTVIVGARSALFLPYADLGLIVVDEEHDAVYKQEDGVHYHARDMAVVRARIADVPIVLSSATPSVETMVNARRGRYRRLALTQRFGGQSEPAIEAIDLKREGPLTGPLHRAAPCRHREDRAGARRSGAAVPQSPRLCSAHALPRLRLPPQLPELRCVAGRPSLQAPACLPSLRLHHTALRRLSEVPCGGFLCCLRTRRGAAGGRSPRAISRPAHPGALQRSHRLDRAHA